MAATIDDHGGVPMCDKCCGNKKEEKKEEKKEKKKGCCGSK
jgi:hypothetical protein